MKTLIAVYDFHYKTESSNGLFVKIMWCPERCLFITSRKMLLISMPPDLGLSLLSKSLDARPRLIKWKEL